MFLLIIFLIFFIPNVIISKISYEEFYVDVPVDHFTFDKNYQTFKLRYLLIDQYHVKGCATFFYCGNEADILVFLENTGFLLDIAPKFNALVVFVEHRYYGESLPFGNQSFIPENLKYLTTSQALADFVWVSDTISKKYYNTMLTNDTYPIIAFGGSYGGMLAAWLRIKYPHIVLGAVASSAPVLLFEGLTPCDTFYQIVTQAFSKVNNCSAPISNSWTLLRNLSKTDGGRKEVSEKLKLCNPVKSDADLNKVIDWLSDIYVNIAMVNYPYPTKFIADLPANPVKVFCDKLLSFNITNNTVGLLEALSEAIQVYTNSSGQTKCNYFETTIEHIVEYVWEFQACTELILPMCSTDKDMFETTEWNYTAYAEECFKIYGVKPLRSDLVFIEYGGKKLKYASNILFTNGLMDPWSSGGVLTNISSTVLSILIPEAVHHYDLRMADITDSNYVVEARKSIVIFIKKCLNIT